MIPLLINQSNIARDFSLQLSKRLVDSDLAVIGLTGIGPIRKIFALDWFLPYWPNESFYIVLTDLTIFRLINQRRRYMTKVNLNFLPDFNCLHLPEPIRKQSVVKSISMFSIVSQFPNHKAVFFIVCRL
jgi:hypothetical protein